MKLIIKKAKVFFKCLFNGHEYFMYYKSKWGGEELWYCKHCYKEKIKF